jgi:hypothetical protein
MYNQNPLANQELMQDEKRKASRVALALCH